MVQYWKHVCNFLSRHSPDFFCLTNVGKLCNAVASHFEYSNPLPYVSIQHQSLVIVGKSYRVSLEQGAGSREWGFQWEELSKILWSWVLLPIIVEGKFSIFIYIQTRHWPQPMIVVHFWIFFRGRNLQGAKWMKLGLATNFLSAWRMKELGAHELHTMICKTWCSGPDSLTIESIMCRTIHKACA